MDWYAYVTGELVEAQLAERRRAAARERLARASRPAPRAARLVIGGALIRIGAWLAGSVPITVHNPGH
jgi:hypothetical protein